MKLTKLRALKNQKIAVLLADGFEAAEYTVPVNAFRAAGAEITVISLRLGRVRGVNLHEPAHKVGVDLLISEANPGDYDALYIPGGFINPDLLRQSERVRNFVAEFDRSGKPIASLCHGPWVLASAHLTSGRTLTSWPGVRDDLVHAGATWLDQPVVRDRNWITSRGPQDFLAFVPALIQFFANPVAEVGSTRTNTASSPQPNEPPTVVLQAFRILPRPSLRGLVLGLAVGAIALKVWRGESSSNEAPGKAAA